MSTIDTTDSLVIKEERQIHQHIYSLARRARHQVKVCLLFERPLVLLKGRVMDRMRHWEALYIL
jgi:hypothetical protein